MSRHSDRMSGLKGSCIILCGDFSLLASVTVAHLIVWRTLRGRHKERVARLKSLRLISGGGQAMGGNQALTPNSMDEKRMLREAVRDSGFRQLRVATLSNVSGE